MTRAACIGILFPVNKMWYKFRRGVVMRQRKCTTKVGEVYHKFRRGVPLIVTKNRISACDSCQRYPEEVSYKFRRSVLPAILGSPDFTEFWIQYFIVIIRRSVVPVFSSKLSYFIYVIVC